MLRVKTPSRLLSRWADLDNRRNVMSESTVKTKLIYIVLPLLLMLTSAIVFSGTTTIFSEYWGNLAGKAFYWIVWCIFVSSIMTKWKFASLFSDEASLFRRANWWVILLFASTMVIPFFMYDTLDTVGEKPQIILLTVIPFAIINGMSEEAFWRGLYVKTFGKSVTWAIIIPSVLFSIWHFIPQLALPHSNPSVFVLTTFPLGLVYAIVAYKTRSAKWSAIGHSISAMLAFAVPDSVSLFQILTGTG